jgi:hypothetical protein
VGVLFRVLARLAEIRSFARGPKAVAARQARRVIYRATNHRCAIGGRRNPKLPRPPLKPSSSTGRLSPQHPPHLSPPRPLLILTRGGGFFMNFVEWVLALKRRTLMNESQDREPTTMSQQSS